jgi:hypothetical protein
MGNSFLLFNNDIGRTITMNGGIITGGIENIIIKKGAGDLIFENASITDFQGDFNIEQGNIIVKAPNITISTLTISPDAKYSMVGNFKHTVYVDSITISGLYEIGINLANNEVDVLIATTSIIIDPTISTLSVRFYGIGTLSVSSVSIMKLISSPVGTDWSFSAYYVDGILNSDYSLARDTNNTNWLNLVWEDIPVPPTPPIPPTPPTPPIPPIPDLDSNQNSVIDVINNATDDELIDLRDEINAGTTEEVKKALAQLSGSFLINAAIISGRTENIDSVFNRISDNSPDTWISKQPAKDKDDKNISTWIQVNYKGENLGSDNNVLGKLDYSQAGFLAGGQITKDIGVFLGYASKSLKQGSDKADISDIELGVFNNLSASDKINVKLALSASMQSVKSDRNIDFASLNPQADFNSQSIKFGAEASIRNGNMETLYKHSRRLCDDAK